MRVAFRETEGLRVSMQGDRLRESPYWLSRRTRPISERDRSDEGKGRTALVTGASAGIGRAMSELLAAKGYDVVPVARRSGRLEELKRELEDRWGVNVIPIAADLAKPESPTRIVAELRRRDIAIDVLVNNAGYSISGMYAGSAWEDQERFLRVIGLSTLELTHLLLPHMIEQRWGRVINVASIAAVMAGTPSMVLYCACKSMVHKFTEGLAAECEPLGVHCTASLPGATDTELSEASGMSEYARSNLGVRLAMMSPVTVARQAYRACEHKQRMVVHGRHHKMWAFVLLHAPRSVRYALCGFIGEIQADAAVPSGSP
jgi:short-subunit dehydrogenase